MKKIVLAVLVLMLFAAYACAQDAPLTKGLIGKGIKAGVTLGNFTGSDADPGEGADKNMLLGFAGGAFVTYGFTPMFAVQPEVLYMMKGVKYQATEGDAKETMKLSFIQVPILLKVMPQMQGSVKPNFFAGPYLGILMSAKDKLEGTDEDYDEDIKDYLKSTEFGITFGAGADFVMGTGKLTVDARYDLGMSKLDDSETALNMKSATIALLVGYSF